MVGNEWGTNGGRSSIYQSTNKGKGTNGGRSSIYQSTNKGKGQRVKGTEAQREKTYIEDRTSDIEKREGTFPS